MQTKADKTIPATFPLSEHTVVFSTNTSDKCPITFPLTSYTHVAQTIVKWEVLCVFVQSRCWQKIEENFRHCHAFFFFVSSKMLAIWWLQHCCSLSDKTNAVITSSKGQLKKKKIHAAEPGSIFQIIPHVLLLFYLVKTWCPQCNSAAAASLNQRWIGG